MAEQAKQPKIQIICGACGSTLVTRDAWAEWDADEQDWTLGAVYDYAFCHTCEGETRLEELPLDS